jgi:hypothetical protein
VAAVTVATPEEPCEVVYGVTWPTVVPQVSNVAQLSVPLTLEQMVLPASSDV